MMSSIRAMGIFCEDVRDEVAGTHTIVGVFPDNINLETVPIALAKLALYVRIMVDPAADPGPISIFLVLPNGDKRLLQELEASVVSSAREEARKSGVPSAGIMSKAIFPAFPVNQFGRLTVVVQTPGEEIVCATLNFQQAPTSSTAPSSPA